MEKLTILLLSFLNILSFLQAIVKLPSVEQSVIALQYEFNALMKEKSCPKCFREYFKSVF